MPPKVIHLPKRRKPPRIKRTVESSLTVALHRAREQAWDKVIIIGQGPDMNSLYHSRMDEETILGLLERSKHTILTD